MNVITIFILHGLVYAGLLFLVSSGLTLVFGMMNVLNFAHASFYMLAAYFSYSLLAWTNNFWLCLILCPFLLFVIGAGIERFAEDMLFAACRHHDDVDRPLSAREQARFPAQLKS